MSGRSSGLDRLQSFGWPGNVRELENLVRRLAALYSQDTIGVEVIEAVIGCGTFAILRLVLRKSSQRSEAHLEVYFRAYGSGLPPGTSCQDFT